MSLPGIPAAFQGLKPNHYAIDTQIGYGCTCEEVLYCKPGTNNGEFKFGCSSGTFKIWQAQDPDSWAPDCQSGGVVVVEGVARALFENTDGDFLIDIFDTDNDNDGLSDGEDDMIEDSDPVGDPDHGIPDWHPKSKHKK